MPGDKEKAPLLCLVTAAQKQAQHNHNVKLDRYREPSSGMGNEQPVALRTALYPPPRWEHGAAHGCMCACASTWCDKAQSAESKPGWCRARARTSQTNHSTQHKGGYSLTSALGRDGEVTGDSQAREGSQGKQPAAMCDRNHSSNKRVCCPQRENKGKAVTAECGAPSVRGCVCMHVCACACVDTVGEASTCIHASLSLTPAGDGARACHTVTCKAVTSDTM